MRGQRGEASLLHHGGLYLRNAVDQAVDLLR